MGDSDLTDHMVKDGLWCPFENRHMGDSAEAIAAKYEVRRGAQDEFAVRSQTRASAAVDSGIFDEEIVAVEVDYHRPFCAMIWCDNLYATQFHPEKSQANGLRILKNFAELA